MPVPNIIHMLFGFTPDFGGKPFSFIHYLCVKSAAEVHRPEAILMHVKHEPEGPWWDAARRYIEVVHVEPPLTIGGRDLCSVSQQADVVRLELLIADGGIYLDADVLSVKGFDPLRSNQTVLGRQAERLEDGTLVNAGLCNAVILASPGSTFLQRWLDGFNPTTSIWSGFRSKGHDDYWDEYSVQYPAMLAERFPSEIHIEPMKSFFLPSYDDSSLELMFGEDHDVDQFEGAYCHHLWEVASWDRYLKDLTPASIEEGRSAFAKIARRFL